MYNLYVGIDLSRDFSSAQGLDIRGKKNFHVTFKTGPDGFHDLLKVIKSHSDDLSRVVASIKPVEPCHLGLFSFLNAKGINTVVVAAGLVAGLAGSSPGKGDAKDANAAAQFLFVNRDSPYLRSLSFGAADLRELARHREYLAEQTALIRNDMKRTHPEPTGPLMDAVLKQKASILQTLDEHLREAESLLAGLCSSMTIEDAATLTSSAAKNEKKVPEQAPEDEMPSVEPVKEAGKPLPQAAPSAAPAPNKAIGLLSAVKVQGRNFQIQTEHVGYPENRVDTIAVLDGKIVMKRSSPPLETVDLKEVEKIIRLRHAEVEQEVREKIHALKKTKGGEPDSKP